MAGNRIITPLNIAYGVRYERILIYSVILKGCICGLQYEFSLNTMRNV